MFFIVHKFSTCTCIYVQYTDIVYWKSCVQILCYVLWRIGCPAPESPNNKTIITLEPIEIPFSFMLRMVLEYMKGYSHTKKLGPSVWLGSGGPRSKGTPNYNFLNYCLSDFTLRDSKDLAFTSILIPRSAKSDHYNL